MYPDVRDAMFVISATSQGKAEASLLPEEALQREAVGGNISVLPQRPPGPGLREFSNVLGGPLRCHSNTPPQFHKMQVLLVGLPVLK